MNGDYLDALQQIAREKEIPTEARLETVESALVTAYKKNFSAQGEVRVRIDSAKATFRVFLLRTVVEEIEDEMAEMSLDEARKYDPEILPGETLEIEVTPGAFGRIAAQTAKQ